VVLSLSPLSRRLSASPHAPPLHAHLFIHSHFVERCAPEQTKDEAEEWLAWWRKLPSEEQGQAGAQRDWSLADWLYWFEPEQLAPPGRRSGEPVHYPT
jgi:hypothetical protein